MSVPDSEQFDVVIAGGGPGGSSLAALVAQRGHRVLVLEGEQFPRYQIGESLLPSTVHGICRLTGAADADRTELARLCARVESDWVGAQTGLLDQLASLYGAPETALLIDFQTLTLEPVPLALAGGWRLVLLDSGERHANASSAYNERRAECAKACELLGVGSLRAASWDALERLPEPLQRRARHVLGENDRVRDTAGALRAGEPAAVGALLNASHASLRDQYEVSTPAVERAVAELLGAGAAGARIVGGGFGGQVLGLFAPGVDAPANAHEVRASAGAHLLDRGEAARH